MRSMQRYFLYLSVSTITAMVFIATYNSQPSKQVHHYTRDTSLAPVVLGRINTNRKYAVFSTTSFGDQKSIGFLFLLPLTALAWKRIGFDSVVIIVGSQNVWNSDPLLFSVLASVRSLDAVVLLVTVHPINSVMVSQVVFYGLFFIAQIPLLWLRKTFRAMLCLCINPYSWTWHDTLDQRYRVLQKHRNTFNNNNNNNTKFI